MLKFFSARDDENESLLGAITEGRSSAICTRWGGITHHSLPLVRDDETAVISQKNADTAFGCAHISRHLKRVYVRHALIPVFTRCAGVRSECRIAAGLAACERIQHSHVC